MSISAISSNDYLSQYLYRINNTQTDFLTSSQSKGTATTAAGSHSGKDRLATDLSALWEALQSGNLTNAQSYFSQLQKDVQAIGANASDSTQSTSVVSSSNSAGDSNPLAKDLSALGEALQSGDLTSAQSIFSNILQHMQPPPPPPDFNVSDSTQSTSTTTASSSVSNSNPLASDLSKLEEALNSGDLTSAQTILAQIMQNMQPPDAIASDSTQSAATSSLFSSGSSDMMSRLIEAMLAAYSGFNTGSNDSKSYYA